MGKTNVPYNQTMVTLICCTTTTTGTVPETTGFLPTMAKPSHQPWSRPAGKFGANLRSKILPALNSLCCRIERLCSTALWGTAPPAPAPPAGWCLFCSLPPPSLAAAQKQTNTHMRLGHDVDKSRHQLCFSTSHSPEPDTLRSLWPPWEPRRPRPVCQHNQGNYGKQICLPYLTMTTKKEQSCTFRPEKICETEGFGLENCHMVGFFFFFLVPSPDFEDDFLAGLSHNMKMLRVSGKSRCFSTSVVLFVRPVQ